MTSIDLQTAVSKFLIEVGGQFSTSTHQAYSQAVHQYLTHVEQEFGIASHLTKASTFDSTWISTFHNTIQQNRSIETEHLYTRALLAFYESRHVTLSKSDIESIQKLILEHRRPKQHHNKNIPTHLTTTLLDRINNHQPTPSQQTLMTRDYLRQLRDKSYMLTSADHGLRVNEVTELQRGDLNGTNLQLPGTDHPISLSSRSHKALSTYLSQRLSQDQQQKHLPFDNLPIFARHDKRASINILPISRWTVHNIVKTAVRDFLTIAEQAELTEANMTISAYTLRHYFVIRALNSYDSSTAQKLSRHKTPATTRRYQKTVPDS